MNRDCIEGTLPMPDTSFVETATIPLRLSAIDSDGFPVVCSLWFYYRNGCFYCASHRSSKIIRLLEANPNCGFEVAVNSIPYRGVRGKAVAELTSDSQGEVLSSLIERYLGDSNRDLANWLLSRKADEVAICLHPKTFSSWDFSARMTD
ncbi:pyridoxamine 5'-phosphate oxidase family protein [uncultured Spongiibacter sp.]|uniref:pyridoxamine 5'-phosphate oxidase family protein n=1 Tax=Spongiibacter marinus TaxID=354246 RepID=UPI00258D10EC|nr:pyridoxamine 5'-phosphate oxidase family protein [uncultured Spongiibacter sp.]MEE2654084.1 pyridoxamine 5'-phosphate oxidase family protein [Pseudomonadota bacterium]